MLIRGDIMSKIGYNIKIARIDAKLTLDELSQKVGVSKQTLSRYENGIITNIPSDNIEKIADVLGVTPSSIMGWDHDIDVFQYKNVIPIPEMRAIPILGTIACGQPITAVVDDKGRALLPKNIKADFALFCKGDSMIDARIKDGDLVFIRSQPSVENGQIAAVEIEGEVTLKKVYLYPNTVMLAPANTNYDPIIISSTSEDFDFRILGLAVYFYSHI